MCGLFGLGYVVDLGVLGDMDYIFDQFYNSSLELYYFRTLRTNLGVSGLTWSYK